MPAPEPQSRVVAAGAGSPSCSDPNCDQSDGSARDQGDGADVAALADPELPLTLKATWSRGQHTSRLHDHHVASLGRKRLEILDVAGTIPPGSAVATTMAWTAEPHRPWCRRAAARLARGSGSSVTTSQPLRRRLGEASWPTCAVNRKGGESTIGSTSNQPCAFGLSSPKPATTCSNNASANTWLVSYPQSLSPVQKTGATSTGSLSGSQDTRAANCPPLKLPLRKLIDS